VLPSGDGGAKILIEFLYFDDCPFYQKAEELLENVLQGAGVEARIVKKNIVDNETAQVEEFIGSPSIRVNGEDIDPAARTSTAYNRMCRVYWVTGGFLGWPTREMIEKAVLRAADQER